MKSFFDAEFFGANRQKLKSLVASEGPIVVTANGLLQRNADSTFPFRQDSSFWYLTGVEEPDLLLVMDGEQEYFIVPGRSETRQAFDGAIDSQTIMKRSGVGEVLGEDEGWQRLKNRLKQTNQAAILMPATSYIASHGLYVNPARRRLLRTIKKHQPNIELADIRETLSQLRSVKQPSEIKAIRKAIDVTAASLKAVKKAIGSYEYEYEVEAAITTVFRKRNLNHAYGPIVAAGRNACILHYMANSGELKSGDILLLDVGAEVENYAADISRSFVKGEPTERQKQVWQAVMNVREFALQNLKPGISIRENEKIVEQFMGEQLRELGLIKQADRESIRRLYPHATSHYLGLDVHDAGNYDRPLEPNMTLTVEPGIYIPEEGIGIRIEDDILITETGNEVLSASLPHDL